MVSYDFVFKKSCFESQTHSESGVTSCLVADLPAVFIWVE